MRLTFAGAAALAGLALSFSPLASSQAQIFAPQAVAEPGSGASSTPAQRFEQAWDVLSIMGKPLPPSAARQPRVVLRPQGSLLVDGGCNHFSGRFERDAQGLFRVSKYGGSHGACEDPPRSEALLNSALMMADGFRWERGALVLLGGQSELLRLQPSVNQDSQEIEQALVRRPAAAGLAAREPARQVCSPVKAAKSRKAKAGKLKASKAKSGKVNLSRVVCKPVKGLKAGGKMSAAKIKVGAKSKLSSRIKASKAKLSKASKTKTKSAAKPRKRAH